MLDSSPNIVWDIAVIHMKNCFCNSRARFMTNEERLKINLSQMRNDMWSYKGLDQRTNSTSAASIKSSCLFFMTSWNEFKGNRPYRQWLRFPTEHVYVPVYHRKDESILLLTCFGYMIHQGSSCCRSQPHWTYQVLGKGKSVMTLNMNQQIPSVPVADPLLWPITSIYVSYLAEGSYVRSERAERTFIDFSVLSGMNNELTTRLG